MSVVKFDKRLKSILLKRGKIPDTVLAECLRKAEEGNLTLTHVLLEGNVRVAVSDGSPIEPAIRRHSMTSTTGRGLQMLASLADDWGSEVTRSGKTVWFTLSSARDHWAGAQRVTGAGK